MKFMKLKLLAIASSVFISAGCQMDAVYKSVRDLSAVREKESMKPFSELNNPIVITMPVYDKRALFGNESMGVIYAQEGDIFVVYDWENNRIHDWAFFPGAHGQSNWRAVEMGTPVKYYDAGDASRKIGCLDPETGFITVFSNPVEGTFTNLNNNQKIKSRYGIIHTSGWNSKRKMGEYRINRFDSETGKTDLRQLVIYSDETYIFYPMPDRDGNFWVMYIEDNYNWLQKIDLENNCLAKPVKHTALPFETPKGNDKYIYYHPSVEGTFKNYVLVAECEDSDINPYPYMTVYDMDNLESEPISIPMPNEQDHKNRIFLATEANGECYGIFPSDYDGDDWFTSVDLYKIDIENRKMIFTARIDFDFTETVYSRGSRIYFIDSSWLHTFRCTYYDVATGEKGEVFEIKQEEIYNIGN